MTPALVPQLGPQDIRAGAITSSHLAITQEAAFHAASNQTFTGDTNYHTIDQVDIFIPDGQQCLFVWANASWRVNAVGAVASFSIGIFGPNGVGFNMDLATGLYSPVANQRCRVNMSAGLNVPANLPGMGLPGVCTLHFYARNDVAVNTLTIDSNTDQDIIHAFITGDSSS